MNDLIPVMMPSLSTFPAMPALDDSMLEKVRLLEADVAKHQQASFHTLHMIHGGMYSRTVMVPADHIIVGTLIKVPTQVIVAGTASLLMGNEIKHITGYNVLPGQAGRKGVFVAITDIFITMIFKTDAKTVKEAEEEFTEEAEKLASRREDCSNVFVETGE